MHDLSSGPAGMVRIADYLVETEGELDRALVEAAGSDTMCIVEVRLNRMDASSALLRLTEKFGAAAGNEMLVT
jgi:hypothetical protein